MAAYTYDDEFLNTLNNRIWALGYRRYLLSRNARSIIVTFYKRATSPPIASINPYDEGCYTTLNDIYGRVEKEIQVEIIKTVVPFSIAEKADIDATFSKVLEEVQASGIITPLVPGTEIVSQ
jgi:hypothetical protein